MGRPRKTLAAHEKDRTFREDRHGGMVPDSAFQGDLPERPADLTADEVVVWDLITGTSPDGQLRAIDAPMLTGMCYSYGEYCRCKRKQRELGVCDPQYMRLGASAATEWKAFTNAAGRFGMSSADRVKLRTPPKKEEEEDALTMLSMIGAKRPA